MWNKKWLEAKRTLEAVSTMRIFFTVHDTLIWMKLDHQGQRIVRTHTERCVLQENQVMKMATEAQHRQRNSRDYLIWMYQTS